MTLKYSREMIDHIKTSRKSNWTYVRKCVVFPRAAIFFCLPKDVFTHERLGQLHFNLACHCMIPWGTSQKNKFFFQLLFLK